MPKQSTTERLNHLVEINREANASLQTAARTIKNSELETLFDGIAKQHAKFVAELESEIGRQGGSIHDTSSSPVSEAVHRGWKDIKAAFSGNSAGSVLAACDSTEQSVEIAYTDAVGENPTGRIHTFLSKHLKEIKELRSRLHRLLEQTKDGVEYPVNER